MCIRKEIGACVNMLDYRELAPSAVHWQFPRARAWQARRIERRIKERRTKREKEEESNKIQKYKNKTK